MPLINPLPYILQNGTVADATQVMADLNQIVNNVNTNVPLLIQPFYAPVPAVFTSGTNLTYTVPLNAAGFLPLYLVVEVVGAGGGGGEQAASGVAGTASTFAGMTANGGAGGNAGWTGTEVGGTSTGGNVFNFTGADGSGPYTPSSFPGSTAQGGRGGAGPFGGGSIIGVANPGVQPKGYGGGGPGGNVLEPNSGGSGGGAGGYCKSIISPVLSSYLYTVGVGGAGSSGSANHGGPGMGGIIIITAHWQ